MNLEDKEFFAEHVHNYIVYQDIERSMQKYEQRLLHELKLRKLPKTFFQGQIIIDIGTGFQAIIASKMGAKFVYHLDQSSSQVTWMQTYCKEHGIDNITSIECNITQDIPINKKVDLVLVFGVWHHLQSPSAFMKNLIPLLNEKEAQIWLRVYRSGSWSRWLIGNLRKLTTQLDLTIIKTIIETRYPYSSADQWKGDLLDDFFAPVWQAFHPNQFAIKGVSRFIDYQDWNYDFNEQDENFRVDFCVNQENRKEFECFPFPEHGIDQQSIVFNTNDETVYIAQKLLDCWKEKPSEQFNLAGKLITLYELVRKKPIFDAYTQSYCKGENSINSTRRMNVLLRLLGSFIKDR